jgi:hypothetical protein
MVKMHLNSPKSSALPVVALPATMEHLRMYWSGLVVVLMRAL